MNDDTKQTLDMDTQQLQRPAKRKAQRSIQKWVDYVHSVGGGDSTHDWHSSSSGISGDLTETDSEISSEEDSSSDSTLCSERDATPEQDVLLKVWGRFLRKGRTNDSGETKRPRLDNRLNQRRKDSSTDLGSTSENDDNSSEGSDGSYGSLAEFIED